MEQRKGLFTPDQEQLIDDLIVLKNPIAEGLDGSAIRIADNKGLQYAKEKLLEKYPDIEEDLYDFIDDVMGVVSELTK